MRIYLGRIGSASELGRFANSLVLALVESQETNQWPADFKSAMDRALMLMIPEPSWDVFSTWPPEEHQIYFAPELTGLMNAAMDYLTAQLGSEIQDLLLALFRLRKSTKPSDTKLSEINTAVWFFQSLAKHSLGSSET